MNLTNISRTRILVFALIAFLLTSCDNPDKDLRNAEQVNTEQSYQDFIQKHPGSQLTAKANGDLANLILQGCLKTNTIRCFQDFINRFPNTKAGKQAQKCLELLEYTQTTNEDTIDAYQSFLKHYPDSEFDVRVKKLLSDQMEENDWNQALLANSVAEYLRFAINHPNSHRLKVTRGKLSGYVYFWRAPNGDFFHSEMRFAVSSEGDNAVTLRISLDDAVAAGFIPMTESGYSYNTTDRYEYSDSVAIVVENSVAGQPATLVYFKCAQLKTIEGSSDNSEPKDARQVRVAITK